MKNLLIYINPSKTFNRGVSKNGNDLWENEDEILVKIQIDNSLRLGWKREDIILVTNFKWEYNGVKSIVLHVNNFCKFSPTASKINAIITLFEKGLIENELYWFHDTDAFELEKITEEEIGLENGMIGITDYGITRVNQNVNRRWSTGTIFFNNGSKEFFEWVRTAVYKYRRNEEIALLALTRHNKYHIKDKMKKINITYNMATRKRDILKTYEIANKPLKVLHFHPFDKRAVDLGNDNIGVCIYGKNKINKVLVPQGLIDIFKKYEIE